MSEAIAAERALTLEDIARMDDVLIGTKEISAVTGTDRYTINRMAHEGRVFGCEPYFVGRKGTWVKVARLEFLKAMGYTANKLAFVEGGFPSPTYPQTTANKSAFGDG